MDDTVMSAVIPMTTPNTVRNDRTLFSRSVSSAIFAFSPREIRMGLPFLPQAGSKSPTRHSPAKAARRAGSQRYGDGAWSPHPFRLPAAGLRWDPNLRLCLPDIGRRKRLLL